MSRGGYWFVSIYFSNKQNYLSRAAQGRKPNSKYFLHETRRSFTQIIGYIY